MAATPRPASANLTRALQSGAQSRRLGMPGMPPGSTSMSYSSKSKPSSAMLRLQTTVTSREEVTFNSPVMETMSQGMPARKRMSTTEMASTSSKPSAKNTATRLSVFCLNMRPPGSVSRGPAPRAHKQKALPAHADRAKDTRFGLGGS